MVRGRPSDDATIRMLNLVALLSETPVPLSLDEIAASMSMLEPRFQYGSSAAGRRTKFSRDKKELLRMGIPIVVSTRSGNQAGVGEYIIDKAQYQRVDFGLTAAELDALQQAAAAVQIGTSWGRQAVQWLGGALPASEVAEATHLDTERFPSLTVLWSAVSRGEAVGFSYHGRARLLHPFALLQRNGFWYVVGEEQSEPPRVKTFRVDRIDGAVAARPGVTFARPEGFDASKAVPADPKKLGGEETALVRVDRSLAHGVIAELGAGALEHTHEDGSVDVQVACASYPAFRSWLLAMVDRAEVLGPPDIRDRVVADLRVLAGGSR